jgi:hypothetical protein
MSHDEELQRPITPEEELEIYGDDYLASKDARVPRWLIVTYIILPIWGFCSLFYYINGSRGWLDRGYWNQLQRAALTTFPSGTIEGEAENSNQ